MRRGSLDSERPRVAVARLESVDMRVVMLVTFVFVVCWLLVAPHVAAAYDVQNPTRACTDCHFSGVESARKGPHGGYTTGTAKCVTCHDTHMAEGGLLLLPGNTVRATCEVCHDGTGGADVYGSLQAQGIIAPNAPAPAAHRIEVTNEIPGGAPSGETTRAPFAGLGALTCTDCHNPHDSETVEPFVGDRLRNADDTTSAQPTNRLLRRQPSGADTETATYGAAWCASCHRGRHKTSGDFANHPVEDPSAWPAGEAFEYGRVARVTGMNTTSTEIGTLGGSNFGYVMPDLNGIEAGPARTAQQGTHLPICQQCHEDARNIGDYDDPSRQGQVLTSAYDQNGRDEGFRPGVDGTETASHQADPELYYNPRFQNFPHESANPRLLVEKNDDLCLNCHIK